MPEHGDVNDRLKRVEIALRDLQLARRLESASIGAGGIRVLNGGQIVWIAADGTTHLVTADQDGILIAGAPVVLDADGLDIGSGLVVVDETGLTVGSAPVVIDADGLDIGSGLVVVDETGLDIGSGLTVIDSTGVQVGSDVVIDSTGLHVDDGLVQAVWGHVEEETTENVSLGSTSITSSATNIHAIVIDPPNWVQQLYVFGTADMMVNASTGAPHRMTQRIIVDDGGASEEASTMDQEKEANGISRSLNTSQSSIIPLSPAGRSVTITQRGTLSSGSSTANRFRLNIMVMGVRDAFV
jgi:hypothetical protein